jgi:glycosyltransferase involved in cell wall biosynthesis
VGLRARKYTHTPVVCTLYNTRWGHFDKYKRWLTLQSDGLVSLNQVTMDDHIALAGSEPIPPHLTRPGTIDTERYHPAKQSQAYRNSLGVGPDHVMLLTLQRMDGRKNMRPILDAFLEITRQHPHVRVFVGGGGPNKAEYEAYIQGQAGGDRVRFLGFVPDDDLPTLYASADIFVAATYGYVNLEAMASETATIVLDHQPQCREFVNDGIGGLLVPDETSALVMALDGLVTDVVRREQISTAGRQFVMDRFDNQRGTQELVALFEQAAQHAKAKQA